MRRKGRNLSGKYGSSSSSGSLLPKIVVKKKCLLASKINVKFFYENHIAAEIHGSMVKTLANEALSENTVRE